jgi:hypothetical protein
LVGREFLDQLASLDRNRAIQLATLARIIPVLDGKQVTLGTASSGDDRGLVISMGDLSNLPTDCDPTQWGPDSEAQKSVANLVSRTTDLLKSCPPELRADLERLAEYLSALGDLTKASYAIAGVYEITIQKQLVGARRQLRKKTAESWTFRFVKSMLESFSEQRQGYEALLKKVEFAKQSLPAAFGTAP